MVTSSAAPSRMVSASQVSHACSCSQSMRRAYLASARRPVLRRAVQRSSLWVTTRGIPKVTRQVALVDHVVHPALRDHPAPAHQHRVAEAGRDLLDVVGHQHGRGAVGVHREHRQRRHQVLATAEVEAGGGLVEQQQLRVRHQGAGHLHPLPLTLGQGAEGPVRQVRDAHLDQQLGRPGVVERVVLLAPPADHAVRRGHDDVADQLVARDPLGQRGRGEADAGPQLEDVHRAEHLAQDRDEAGRRVGLRGGHLDERGLAGAVGTEDHPALVLLDRPGHRLEESRRPAPDGDVGELQDGGHVAHPSEARTWSDAVRRVASRPVTNALPDAGLVAWWSTAWLRGDVVTDLVLDALRAPGRGRRMARPARGRPARGRDRRRAGAARRGRSRWGWAVRRPSTPWRWSPARPWCSRRPAPGWSRRTWTAG